MGSPTSSSNWENKKYWNSRSGPNIDVIVLLGTMLGDKHRITGWHPVVWQNHPVTHFDHRIICTIIHFLIMIIVHACTMIIVHAFTMIIVYACSLMVVHSCIMIIV